MSDYPGKPVVIVDDESYIIRSLTAVLRSAGINNIKSCSDSRNVLSLISAAPPSLVLLDLTMPHISGEQLLPEIKKLYPDLPVIIITGVNELATAVDCMKNGASDYLVKAIENSKLITSVRSALSIDELREENRLLKKTLLSPGTDRDPAFGSIITVSPAMLSVFKYLSVISRTNQTVLIRGETGTGKELVAEGIHKASGRTGDFICINAAGLDDAMFADTLFGHKKGAYSGAEGSRAGLIEKAADGTLFLDEIGDLSAGSQIKLLRLLEKGEYYQLGSDRLRKASCRIITATNSDLEEQMKSLAFRKDLYYRLSSHEVFLPPLRDRQCDIPLLVRYFSEKISEELGRTAPDAGRNFIKRIAAHDFPGNIRELQTVMNRCISSCMGKDPDGGAP